MISTTGPIIEHTQISDPLHANTDVLDGEVQQHTVQQIVDVLVSLETAEEHISECIVEKAMDAPVPNLITQVVDHHNTRAAGDDARGVGADNRRVSWL